MSQRVLKNVFLKKTKMKYPRRATICGRRGCPTARDDALTVGSPEDRAELPELQRV